MKNIEVRKRIWNNDPAQEYVFYLKLYGSQKEIEHIRKAIFEIPIKEGSESC